MIGAKLFTKFCYPVFFQSRRLYHPYMVKKVLSFEKLPMFLVLGNNVYLFSFLANPCSSAFPTWFLHWSSSKKAMRLIKFSVTWICMRVWIELTNEPQISIVKRNTEKKIENLSSNWLRHLKHNTDDINHHGYVISQLIWIQVLRLSDLSTINM